MLACLFLEQWNEKMKMFCWKMLNQDVAVGCSNQNMNEDKLILHEHYPWEKDDWILNRYENLWLV